ncbi:MAG: hypothetical protein Q8M29_01190 [Bacteroidota bacterium]|nr:hypothetical protein [Bacteroidota bacterium]
MVKLKGTTIVEVLVSMTIILVCSSLATLIYLNILNSQNSSEKLRAFFQLKKIQEETIAENRYINEEIQDGVFTVKKECRPYQSSKNLIQLRIVVLNEKKKELIDQSILVSSY